MKYEIKQFVMRFRPGQIISGEELVSEGIDANKWVKEGLLEVLSDNPLSQEEKKFDLNNDGKVDKEDGKLASKVFNKIRKSRK